MTDFKSAIQTLISDFQENLGSTGVPRRTEIAIVKNKASICIGVRRCGKTTLIMQVLQKLIARGVPKENIVHVNFFDDRLYGLRNDHLDQIVQVYYGMYPEKKNSEEVVFFFDEIQTVDLWEGFIDRLMRTEKCLVFVTGSSAKMLSREIATQMRGRALTWELFPFTFREFLDFKKIEVQKKLTTKMSLLIKKAFNEYWECGGFPEVLAVGKKVRIQIHQEYFNSILFRDLIERHDISHPKALLELSHWLVNNIASLYSINNLTGYLKISGHGITKSTVVEYLQWLEDVYCFFSVRIFDASINKQNVNPKKVYCIDHSFIMSMSTGILVNSGHLLENLVFIALRKNSYSLFYYKTRKGNEVDFIAIDSSHQRHLFQVCYSLGGDSTLNREMEALKSAMDEQGLKTGSIITFDQKETIPCTEGVIEIIPVWEFLLKLEENV
jgi:predicted AAA+ superfamily ATPase